MVKIKKIYSELNKIRSGQEITKKLHSLIINDQSKIKLKRSDGRSQNSYDHINNTLIFNLSSMRSSRVGCVIRKRSRDGRYEIGRGSNPGYIVLGHELIHAIDF